MQWTDEGIVLGVKRHGEASGILELMTREHGRHLGMVRGGFGSRLKPILQGSIAFVRHIDEAAACMYALHEVLKSQNIPVQGVGREAYRS